jgi:hypothetical protein
LRFFDTVRVLGAETFSLRASLKSRCAKSPQEQVSSFNEILFKLIVEQRGHGSSFLSDWGIGSRA